MNLKDLKDRVWRVTDKDTRLIISDLLEYLEECKIGITESSEGEDMKCPSCGRKMLSRDGKYGKFWGCSDYPSCKGTRDSMGRSKSEREAEKNKPREDKRWEVPS